MSSYDRTPNVPANQFEVRELNDESDFETILSSDGRFSICGFGSLLSERSARSTFPDLVNFRLARLNGFRRVFAHVTPVFLERGIARPETKIGVLIEDKELVNSYMGGKPWKAGKFSLTLRLSLWSEHLGLHAGEIDRIIDPVSDSTYKDIWMATAKTNTAIYQDVFSCIPNDFIHTRAAIRHHMGLWREKVEHTTIDLGIAPEKLESYQNGDVRKADPLERLVSVKGHLVSFPLDFMCKEDLRPVFNESEYYASPQVFH